MAGTDGPGIRLDTHCYPGYFVPPYYDSLLAKLIVHGETGRNRPMRRYRALENFHVDGIDTLIPFLKAVIADAEYRSRQSQHPLAGKEAGRVFAATKLGKDGILCRSHRQAGAIHG